MLLRTSVAVFAATVSLGLWSEACAGGEWPATELNVPPPANTDEYWQKDITVVAIAPDGTWGVATDPITGRAIANAMADCKNKYQSKIGCGSQMTFVHGGWSIGKRCGDRNIFVAEESLAKAEQAAINREAELRKVYAPDMPPCVRVMSIDPNGNVVAPNVADLLRIVTERQDALTDRTEDLQPMQKSRPLVKTIGIEPAAVLAPRP
jgi:hypothetical protein